MNLREAAKGMPCMIRLPGVCNHDPATTVLAHYRMNGICGAGMKPPDTCAVWACCACHDLLDGRSQSDNYTREQVHLAALQGAMRTLAALHHDGWRMRK
jgi:hypothetical protein